MRRAGEVLREMERLPWADLDAVAPSTALVLAPHPDDESLGCGGLIATACARGRPPIVVVVTDGAGSHPGSASHPPARLQEVREAELHAAVAILGLPPGRVALLRLPDTRAPQEGADFEAAVAAVAGLVRRHDATTICTTWRHDPHGDHAAAQRIGEAAAGATGATLLEYPVWGWTLPAEQGLDVADVAGARLYIGPHLPLKRRAIAAHSSQYADLITDAPNGFRLRTEFLAFFDRPFEVFLRAP